MTVFSAIDIQSRFEIQDMLSRFCHALDRNDLQEWARLFRSESIIEAPRLGRFVGVEEIMKIPGIVLELGGGAWRHYLNNVSMRLLGQQRCVRVEAYCLVSNWRAGGQIVRSWDLRAVATKRREWQLLELSLHAVPCADLPHPAITSVDGGALSACEPSVVAIN